MEPDRTEKATVDRCNLCGKDLTDQDSLESSNKRIKVPLSVIAEVVWSTTVPARSKYGGSEYEIGVKFLDIYEDDYKALLGYLEKQAKN